MPVSASTQVSTSATVTGQRYWSLVDTHVAWSGAFMTLFDPRSAIAECTQGESLYPPEGCGAEWSAYEACVTQATYSSCANGPDGCDTQQNAYVSCQSRFASRTSCSRTPGQDAKCSGSAPYAYGCGGALPAGCAQLPTTGGATIACCPAFAPM